MTITPPVPPLIRRHAANGRARAQGGAGYVDGKHSLEVVERQLGDRRDRTHDAGVVHQHGDRAKFRVTRLKQALHVRLEGNVGLNGDGRPAALHYGIHDLGGAVRTLAIVHADGILVLGPEPGCRRPDTAAAAGHNHHVNHIFHPGCQLKGASEYAAERIAELTHLKNVKA